MENSKSTRNDRTPHAYWETEAILKPVIPLTLNSNHLAAITLKQAIYKGIPLWEINNNSQIKISAINNNRLFADLKKKIQ